jgi:hypothetical protein
LSYVQAAELTWPQLMHALGIEPSALMDSEADLIVAKQDEIFERIIDRRRCWPVDLLQIPTSGLATLVAAESGGKPPTQESLLSGLQRYINSCR